MTNEELKARFAIGAVVKVTNLLPNKPSPPIAPEMVKFFNGSKLKVMDYREFYGEPCVMLNTSDYGENHNYWFNLNWLSLLSDGVTAPINKKQVKPVEVQVNNNITADNEAGWGLALGGMFAAVFGMAAAKNLTAKKEKPQVKKQEEQFNVFEMLEIEKK